MVWARYIRYIKGASRRVLAKSAVVPLIWLSRDFLKDAGWFRSISKRLPVTKDDQPLPWLTYPSIRFLQDRLSQEMRVFEYGSGYSTLWWAARVSQVVSCEHNRQWCEKMRELIPSNVHLHYVDLLPEGEYSRFILNYKDEFDIVLIDGMDRVNCVKNSLSALKSDGVLIWDNAHRKQDQEGYDFLLRNDYKRIDFYGIGPICTYAWLTSIFYKEGD